MSNITLFEDHILKNNLTPIEVRLHKGKVRRFFAHDDRFVYVFLEDGQCYGVEKQFKIEEDELGNVYQCLDIVFLTINYRAYHLLEFPQLKMYSV